MKITTVNHGSDAFVGPEVHALVLSAGDMRLHITEDPNGMVTIAADPRGDGYVARLDVQSISVTDVQARLVLKGKHMGDDKRLAAGTIAVEVQNIIDRRRLYPADETKLLSSLITLRDFVLGMKR